MILFLVSNKLFLTLFEYLLTDRGSEFKDPDALETGINGLERTSIYYCDPVHSDQKEGWDLALKIKFSIQHNMFLKVLNPHKKYIFI